MKKIAILLIALMTISIGFLSGCNEETKQTSNSMIIHNFQVSPTLIEIGGTANLTWNVTGATTVSIDNNIGTVSLKGTRIIKPTQTTNYTLTVTNATDNIPVTTQIIVITNNSEENNSESSYKNNPEYKAALAGTTYPVAVLETSKGVIAVELYDDKAPLTCQNFVSLVNDGFYDGLVFHRVIPNFMIQTGGFLPNGTPKSSPYGNIQFETSNVKHADGAISMASTGAKVGGSSQFFICDGAQSYLDGNYAAFGKVIYGMDVVREISSVQTTTKIINYKNYTYWPVNDIIIQKLYMAKE